MTFVYQCLKRSRMAKHEVLERLLLRKIKDGKWVKRDDGVASFKDAAPAIEVIKASRSRLEIEAIKRCLGTEMLLEYFPELVVGYDYGRGVHYVEIQIQRSEEQCSS